MITQIINALKIKALSLSYFTICTLTLSVYGTQVCPYIDSLDNSLVFLIFSIGFGIAVLIKLIFEPYLVDKALPIHRPSNQFKFDFSLYILVGIFITAFNFIFLQFPVGSGIKVIMGCLTLGAFASLDNALFRERHAFQEAAPTKGDTEKIFPMTQKLSLVFGLMGVLTVIVVALVVINDMDFMMKNRLSMSTEELKKTVFTDIGFVIGTLVLLSLKLIHSFTQNLNYLLKLQINTLDYVASGELETFVPLITRDEFRLIASKTNSMIEGLKIARDKEETLMEMMQDLSSEIELKPLLDKIVKLVSKFLDADRSSLFIYDKNSDQLWAIVAQQLNSFEIRISKQEGLAGHTFTTGETIRIKNAYEDHRFNIKIDIESDYKTRSVLCMQIHDKNNQPVGVIQAVNKRTGAFTENDEKLLCAFCAQAAITLINAQMYDELKNMQNYDESVLKSLSNSIVTLDKNHNIVKVNDAAKKLLKTGGPLVGRAITDFFDVQNKWIINRINQVYARKTSAHFVNVKLTSSDHYSDSVNLTIDPLFDINNQVIGVMLVTNNL